MKKAALISLVIFLAVSCEKDNTCGCKNPIEDLPWLKELKNSFTNCTCRMSIIQGEFHKHTVFYAIMNDELCDGWYTILLRDCDGNIIKSYEPGDFSFAEEVKDRKTIYTCKTGMYK